VTHFAASKVEIAVKSGRSLSRHGTIGSSTHKLRKVLGISNRPEYLDAKFQRTITAAS
jgi:hypothetical protein